MLRRRSAAVETAAGLSSRAIDMGEMVLAQPLGSRGSTQLDDLGQSTLTGRRREGRFVVRVAGGGAAPSRRERKRVRTEVGSEKPRPGAPLLALAAALVVLVAACGSSSGSGGSSGPSG